MTIGVLSWGLCLKKNNSFVRELLTYNLSISDTFSKLHWVAALSP